MLRTKGETLIYLKKKGINIPKTLLFDASKIRSKQDIFYKFIKSEFKNQKIAIRSSASSEDTSHSSNAGKYESILNVSSQNREDFFNSIKTVVNSYPKKTKNNQVIFQEMINDVKFSGVITNLDIKNYSPHVKINFSKGEDTTQITAGKKSGDVFTYLPNTKYKPKNKTIFNLIKILNKIKKILKINYLDIEFLVTKKNKIFILQARKIVIPKKTNVKNLKEIQNHYTRIEKKIIKLQQSHYDLKGSCTFFGVMPDWNPAEIIGIKPKPLALSLYQELITDHVWSLNREKYGYKNLSSYHLMTSFYGTPYIDVRIDFNSWLPAKLNDELSKKLVNFYLNKFKKNKKFHDKIEFEIIFSCYTFSTRNKLLKELGDNKFSSKEIKEIENNLKIISKNNFNKINDEISALSILIKKQNLVKKSKMYEIQKIYCLVEDCKKFGTLPFAGLARCGFVAIDLLNSMIEQKIISSKDKDNFLASINGMTTRISNDLLKMNKSKFLNKYGHLRPNSYEISSLNYRDGYDLYFDKKQISKIIPKKFKFKFNKYNKKRIKDFLKEINVNQSINKFLKFLECGIFYREYSKFIFTKSIDLIFQNLKIFAKKHKIDQNEISYTKINNFLEGYFSIDNQLLVKRIKESIITNKTDYLKNAEITLPEIILKPEDLYINEQRDSLGNFITTKTISGKVKFYNSLDDIKHLENRIVLIENADPGYDFLFSKNIKGLITKYGGQNSHMSIRSAELRLPACIGVGDAKFEKFKHMKYLTLDCKNHKIL